ncbi:hypothetical protein LCGC14_2544790 [marine sediment metagenome]|uniref:Uncharacterized protein n=1 Tax=marine sediment metagenome TaxID=412755 RepID=A0A0F9DHR0_9ZZZZ
MLITKVEQSRKKLQLDCLEFNRLQKINYEKAEKEKRERFEKAFNLCVANLIIKKDKMRLSFVDIVHNDLKMEKQYNRFKVAKNCEYFNLVKQWIEKEDDGLYYEITKHMYVGLK